DRAAGLYTRVATANAPPTQPFSAERRQPIPRREPKPAPMVSTRGNYNDFRRRRKETAGGPPAYTVVVCEGCHPRAQRGSAKGGLRAARGGAEASVRRHRWVAISWTSPPCWTSQGVAQRRWRSVRGAGVWASPP